MQTQRNSQGHVRVMDSLRRGTNGGKHRFWFENWGQFSLIRAQQVYRGILEEKRLQKPGGGTKWLEEIHSNPKFYIYHPDPVFGIIHLGIFDRKGGNGKCRSREKMENTGKTCNFSPRANLIKHRKKQECLFNTHRQKKYEKGKSKSGMVITCKPMSTELLGVSSFPF